MDYLWFRWTLGWNHQLKKTCFLVGWLMTVSGDVCTCCIFSLNWPIRVRESRFVAENQWSDWPPRILKIPLPNQVIKVKYSNIRLQIFELILSNPNQTFWIFVKPESRFWEANIRISLHWYWGRRCISWVQSWSKLRGLAGWVQNFRWTQKRPSYRFDHDKMKVTCVSTSSDSDGFPMLIYWILIKFSCLFRANVS